MPFLLTAAVWCVPSSHFGAVGFSINYKSKKTKTLEIVTSRSPWAHLPPSVKGRETPTEVRDRRAVVLTERETEGFDGEARRGMRGYEG